MDRLSQIILWPVSALIFRLTTKIPLSHISWHIKVLSHTDLYFTTITSLLGLKFGWFDRSITNLESILGALEEEWPIPKSQLAYVMEDLYTVLTSLYLRLGSLDDAALTVIRANSSLHIDRLIGVPELSSKLAHVIKAGITAARILEDRQVSGTNTLRNHVKPDTVSSKLSLSKIKPLKPNNEKSAKVLSFRKPLSADKNKL